MSRDRLEDGHDEMRLIFADGSSVPFAVRELVATIRDRRVLALTCLFALLLALPGGGAFAAEVPLWARLVLNLFAVALFSLLFPAILREVEAWARWRRFRRVHEPMVTMPTALITSLAVEALTVFVVGHVELARRDLMLKLGFGVVFWELHISMMLKFMGPALRAKDPTPAPPPSEATPRTGLVRIGNSQFDPADVLRLETDDHFLVIHRPQGSARVLASLHETLSGLEPFGLQVHRCHWVSFRDLGQVSRIGRSHQMLTRSGHRVPVARDRRKAVIAALERRSAEPGAAG